MDLARAKGPLSGCENGDDRFLDGASPWPNLALQLGLRRRPRRQGAGQQMGAGKPVAVQTCPAAFHFPPEVMVGL